MLPGAALRRTILRLPPPPRNCQRELRNLIHGGFPADRSHGMSTVTSADGTVIDYDSYGEGPAVIFIGGAATYRAIDQGTTQAARLLATVRS
jgi:hypothetical protein